MTIEIKQLIIRAVADGRREQITPAPAPAAMAAPAPARPAPHPAARAEDREAIVAACVREVLRRLERVRDR